MIDQIVSHYRILEKLGEGGMGIVYKAEDTKLKRHVALKFLPTSLTADAEAKERFIQEAQAASALDHPNICTIYEINQTEDGQMFIAMAYYGGETLKQKVASGQSHEAGLSVDSAIDIASQIGKGLAKAHQHGIFHRDIKPANIIITNDELVKIIDFGLAKLAGQARLTKTGTTIGTVAYMSPEQVRGEEVDHRTDIWSLGVVLYEMITGKLPFGGDYEQAMLYSIVHENPKLMAEYVPAIPEHLQHIVDKALEKDREARYQHVDDLLLDLKQDEKSTAKRQKPITAKRAMPKQKKLRPAAVVMMGIVLVAIVFYYILTRQSIQTLPPTHKQITFTGNAKYPAISPDGQFIAYVNGKIGDQKVMLQDLAGGQPLEILAGIDFSTLKWSPEGSELITTATLKDSSVGTFFVPRLGGAPRRTRIGALLSPSPDGSRIAAISLYGKEILLFNTTTSAFEKNTIPVNGYYDWMLDLDWSPLGNRILLLIVKKKGQLSIWTIKTDGSQQQQVVEDSVFLHSPRWSGSGEAIYYLRSIGPSHDLMKVPISAATGEAKVKPQILQSGLQSGEYFSLSKNNQRALYTRELRYSNLWLVNLEGAGAGKTRQITTGTSWIHSPAISPDGKKIAFSIGERPRANIYVMPIEGGEMTQITFSNYYNASPAWNPNGKELVYSSNEAGRPRVCRIDANGGTTQTLENSDLSPDGFSVIWAPGAQILYQRPGNRNFRILNPLTSEERSLVANDSVGWMFSPCFSPDGKNIAVAWNRREPGKARGSTTASGLWLISLEDSSQKFLLKGNFYPIGWSADGNWIYAWRPDKKPFEIIKVPVNGGKPKTITTLTFENVDENGISMTPDEKYIVCAVFETQSDVWLMENFDPAVGK